MKRLLLLSAAIGLLASSAIATADEGKECKMMKPQPPPPPTAGCKCCEKPETPAANTAAQPDLDQLIAKAKEAKGDQALEAFAALLNKLVEERKAAQPTEPATAAPAEHHH